MNDKILVSICCITYNHENYIKKCLDGFLMQQCCFNFEILIHDDASTDRTKEMIKEYEVKYPNIIKPIYQLENQKSKFNNGMNPRFNYPRAKGKYIALCEGDDFWTDSYKLQKQIDFLEANKDYVACFHNAQIENSITNSNYLYHQWSEDREISAKEAIETGGYLFPTASLVFKRIDFDKIDKNAPAGDLELLFNLTLQGKLFYFSDVMCVYRRHEEGMYSKLTTNNKNLILFNKSVIKYLIKKLERMPNNLKTTLKGFIGKKIKTTLNIPGCSKWYVFSVSKYLSYREIAKIIFNK